MIKYKGGIPMLRNKLSFFTVTGLVVVALLLTLAGCPVTGSGPTFYTVDLSGYPAGKQVYLVTVNTNPTLVTAGDTGGVQGSYSGFSGSAIGPSGSLVGGGAVPPGHHPGAVAFSANPPPITPDMLQSPVSAFSASVAPPSYTVGSLKTFWVETTYESGSWVQKSARLCGQGDHSNVWVIESWGTALTDVGAAQTLAAKFDDIYPLETGVLGYEYGGGLGGSGGKDGDGRVQILVYDFYAGGGSGNAAGFYWPKDFYTQEQLVSYGSSVKTNLAEIFYINAQYLNTRPDFIYSTLAHEFQHMINFNVKYVQHSAVSQTWYNEMLSMMAEDMISPLIGIVPTNSDHPIPERIGGFLTSYANEGVTQWNQNFTSYSTKYAFGAYLARNYGGAALVKNILANNSANEASIAAALGINFNYAVEKFAEAFIYSNTADGATFNQTVTKTINGNTYTFTGFDIWNATYNLDVPAGGYYCLWGGPRVYALTSHPTMQPYSVYVQSSGDWVTGSALTSLTLIEPAAAGVKQFIMVR
jgi:hypothetical protein